MKTRKRIAALGVLGLVLAIAAGCSDITRTGSGTGGGGAGAGVDSSQTNAPIGGSVGTNATGTTSGPGAAQTGTGPDKPLSDGSHQER